MTLAVLIGGWRAQAAGTGMSYTQSNMPALLRHTTQAYHEQGLPLPAVVGADYVAGFVGAEVEGTEGLAGCGADGQIRVIAGDAYQDA